MTSNQASQRSIVPVTAASGDEPRRAAERRPRGRGERDGERDVEADPGEVVVIVTCRAGSVKVS